MSQEKAQFKSSPEGRRSFLKGAGVVGVGVVGTTLLTPSKSQAQVDDDFYLKLTFEDIRRHENEHVPAVQNLITSLGGTPRPKPTFRNLTMGSRNEFLQTARTFENLGVGAYLGATPLIFNANVVAAAGSIALIEGRHAGWLNHIIAAQQTNVRRVTANVYGLEQSFERALTRDEVLSFYLDFHQNLNGGPPLFFGNYSNTQNDINILNFALALEFLEQEFYNINVPVLFP